MNISSGDYFSVSSKGYVKHPNIEIIGIQNYPSLTNLKANALSSRSTEREYQDKSVIKEEEVEYQPLQPRNPQEITSSSLVRPFSNNRQIMEKEQVSSVNMTQTPRCLNENNKLTYSCIANNSTSQNKGILKRSLHEIQKKNITSQQDANCDQQLYIQLEKQRRIRRQLEAKYKNLLSQVSRKERSYSVDLNGSQRDQNNRKRQFSKRTLHEQGNNHRQTAYQQLSSLESKQKSDVKTVRLQQPIKTQKEQYQSGNQSSQQNLSYQKYEKPSQNNSREEQQEYFREQRDFQERTLSQIKQLNNKIIQIERFLIDRQKQNQKQGLMNQIKQKQEQIRRIQQQNKSIKEKVDQNVNHSENNSIFQIDFLKNIHPTNFYLFIMILMALVAMS